ncbi:hypothetical protein BX661DRAFT_187955 [Kickxella alabastrina]|uniref:uncharacterized protein n=1 Tax=Kickxella alabastrina TaxID=61397 RepID=UPI00221E96BA|nr:uncharacterized protein BX661DRAFT_187955 [Kickxella alabastrina]KAI7821794.1 hypothetical protein BX661DRAFT_187955 [Kickxella alabastrina]
MPFAHPHAVIRDALEIISDALTTLGEKSTLIRTPPDLHQPASEQTNVEAVLTACVLPDIRRGHDRLELPA